MMIVRKSPNMMSTIGRSPVIAAPTPRPVNPASEIGVSMTRSLPNSSTSPISTLNVVPASATSSPIRTTVGSRRISSAIASLMASPNEISRAVVTSSGIDVFADPARVRIGRVDRELHRGVHRRDELRLNGVERGTVDHPVGHQPFAVQRDGVPLPHPLLLFRLRPVVGTRDVADMVAVIAVGDELQERGPLAVPCPLDVLRRCRVDLANVLAVDRLVGHPERGGACADIAGSRLGEVRVLVVAVVLADEDHRQLPQLREVHLLVEQALAERALAEKAHRDLAGLEVFRRERGARRDAGAAADNRVGTQIPGVGIGDVHRPALPLAVARFLAEQFRKHAIGRRAFREAVSVAAVGARDVVRASERLADAGRDRVFADVQVSEPRHQRAGIEVVDPLLEQPDRHHLPVHVQQVFDVDSARRLSLFRGYAHLWTPAIRASASKTIAKSWRARPMPRAAVSISLVTVVVGSGTSSWRPISRASCMSFCIMLTSNHASSGMLSTNGPRYCTIGDAMTLCVITSTATSRGIPLFSASRTTSENASIWTARLRLIAIFITSPRPFSPTYVTLGPRSRSISFTRSKVSARPPTMTESFP